MNGLKRFLGVGAAALAVATGLPALADPLATPAMTPPLSANPNPVNFDAGPFGKVYVSGVLTGLGLVQDNNSPYDRSSLADLSNGQVFIQTTSGPVQFFLEAGAYSLPDLGAPYVHASPTTNNTYSALPVGYVKFQPTAEFSIEVGKLPTLIGAEYTFSFQNMNIERGLLWNQEPAVSDGVQVNYAKGKITLSASLNDGFYSNRYNWVSGLASYAITGKDTIAFAGGTSLSTYVHYSTATPLLQNNGGLFDIIYTHADGPWVITPYFQYTHSSRIAADGFELAGADTYSGAILAKYSFNANFSLAGRVEYVSSSSAACPLDDEFCGQSNVLYGPGSRALSLTVTPTYQKGIFFVRAEFSYVDAMNTTPGDVFGQLGENTSQVRGLVETGFIF